MAKTKLGKTEFTIQMDGANVLVTRLQRDGKLTKFWFPPELLRQFAHEQMVFKVFT